MQLLAQKSLDLFAPVHLALQQMNDRVQITGAKNNKYGLTCTKVAFGLLVNTCCAVTLFAATRHKCTSNALHCTAKVQKYTCQHMEYREAKHTAIRKMSEP